MGERPQFSVIIPTFNRVELLKRALDSVFCQRFKEFEIIVVDDGSTDGTRKYLQDLGAAVKFCTQPNSGPSGARNAGARQARGEYLAFLDSDDLWFPWTLDIYAMVLVKANYPAFMAGKPRRFVSEEALSDIREASPQWQQFEDYLESGDQWRWWGVSSFVIQRETFMNVGGFSVDLENGEDGDLALRLGTARGFVQLTAPDTFAYREHAGNIAHDLSRNVAALQREIVAECSGEYPGGPQRCWQRRQILARHVRPVALECARFGLVHEAWALYWSTFGWHVSLRRWRFLGAFPLLALLGLTKSKRNHLNDNPQIPGG
jgi:glycosyltransferase involved in cell wall biosynthesis